MQMVTRATGDCTPVRRQNTQQVSDPTQNKNTYRWVLLRTLILAIITVNILNICIFWFRNCLYQSSSYLADFIILIQILVIVSFGIVALYFDISIVKETTSSCAPFSAGLCAQHIACALQAPCDLCVTCAVDCAKKWCWVSTVVTALWKYIRKCT